MLLRRQTEADLGMHCRVSYLSSCRLRLPRYLRLFLTSGTHRYHDPSHLTDGCCRINTELLKEVNANFPKAFCELNPGRCAVAEFDCGMHRLVSKCNHMLKSRYAEQVFTHYKARHRKGTAAEAAARKNGTSAHVGVAPCSKSDLSDDGDRQWDGRIVWISTC